MSRGIEKGSSGTGIPMNNGFDTVEICRAVSELIAGLGIKEDCDIITSVRLASAKKIEAVALSVARQYGLPVSVSISVVKSGDVTQDCRFDSYALARTDRSGRAVESIAAQVFIPADLPVFGSRELTSFPIEVRVSENYFQHPYVILCVLAHEFAHVLLYSLRHPLRESEIHTDLTAMICGFTSAMRLGRKTSYTSYSVGAFKNVETTHTTTYGYLSDEQFSHAESVVWDALREFTTEKKAILNNVSCVRATLRQLKFDINLMRELVLILDSCPRSTIRSEHASVIVDCHSPDYFDSRERFIHNSANKADEIEQHCRKTTHFTKSTLAPLQQMNAVSAKLLSSANEQREAADAAVRIVKKYVPLVNRIRIMMKRSASK